MKKNLKQLIAGFLMMTALMIGGWMLTESLDVMQEISTEASTEIHTDISMEEALVVRP